MIFLNEQLGETKNQRSRTTIQPPTQIHTTLEGGGYRVYCSTTKRYLVLGSIVNDTKNKGAIRSLLKQTRN